MVRVVIILFVVFLLIGQIRTAVEFCDNASLAKIDIFSGLTAINIVSGVGVESSHIIEIQSFRILCVLICSLSVLTVYVSCIIVCVYT